MQLTNQVMMSDASLTEMAAQLRVVMIWRSKLWQNGRYWSWWDL